MGEILLKMSLSWYFAKKLILLKWVAEWYIHYDNLKESLHEFYKDAQIQVYRTAQKLRHRNNMQK